MRSVYWTIWLALSLLCAGEAARWSATARPPRWAWWTFTAGALLCAVHIVIAMNVAHGWNHDAAVAATRRQTREVFGLDWGGGVFLNYVFVAVWLFEAWRWRTGRTGSSPDALTWGVRILFLIMIVNGAIVFAAGPRRIAGAVIAAVLCWAYFGRRRLR